MLFRFVIPINPGEVGFDRVGKFLRERRNKVVRYVVRVHFQEGVRGEPWKSVGRVQALNSELFSGEQLEILGRIHFPGRARRVETVNRTSCVSDLNRETGVHFRNGLHLPQGKTWYVFGRN
jgi:hypothetical protein